jgi:hypothetical protein
MNLLFYAMVTTTGFCGMGLLASLMLSRTSRAASKRALSVIEGRSTARNLTTIRSNDLRKTLTKATHWLVERLGMSNDPALLMRFERAGLFASSYRDLYLACRVV